MRPPAPGARTRSDKILGLLLRCRQLLLGVLLTVHIAAATSDIAVVVRRDTPAEDLSLSEVRKLLLGERQFWNSSLRVTLLIRSPGSRERDVVLRVLYRMSDAQFRQYWISKIFRAEAVSGPRTVYSNELAIDLLNALPGSIAFLEASEVPKGLKIVRIDGKLPGEKTYPLR
jgi:hypothetical protein